MSAGDKGVTTILGIKKRADFVKIEKEGFRVSKPSFVLLWLKRDEKLVLPDETCRVGYTTSKKVGNAVQRNRCRRRLRAVVMEVMPDFAHSGYDYVLIAKTSTIDREYSAIVRDLQTALSFGRK